MFAVPLLRFHLEVDLVSSGVPPERIVGIYVAQFLRLRCEEIGHVGRAHALFQRCEFDLLQAPQTLDIVMPVEILVISGQRFQKKNASGCVVDHAARGFLGTVVQWKNFVEQFRDTLLIWTEVARIGFVHGEHRVP